MEVISGFLDIGGLMETVSEGLIRSNLLFQQELMWNFSHQFEIESEVRKQWALLCFDEIKQNLQWYVKGNDEFHLRLLKTNLKFSAFSY